MSYEDEFSEAVETGDDATKILSDAKDLFARCVKRENVNRESMLNDMQFAAASPDQTWQWPDDILKFRQQDIEHERPCLTINLLPQHINQITNDVRQNRPSIKVLPVNDNADTETAKIINGLIRHIEYISDADVAYDRASHNQVTAGLGYLRVLNDYYDPESFEQELFIQAIDNPMSVYMDPLAMHPTACDAEFCFVTDMLRKEEFDALYPEESKNTDWDALSTGDSRMWFDGESVRVCEFYRIERKNVKMRLWSNGKKTFGEEPPPEGVPEGEKPIKERETCIKQVVWRKLTGGCILEKRVYKMRWIPIVRVIGNDFFIEGERYISGIVRNAKDAQRMYNYHKSQEAEMLALSPRAPWVGYTGQFEGHETKWKRANVTNFAYLEVNPYTDDMADGAPPLPLPQRVMPPQAQAGLLQAAQGALADVRATTGQYEASLGMKGNETSARAILFRNKEGDIGTYHYADNLRKSIRQLGRIIIEFMKIVYDARRVARIVGEDGDFDFITLDPTQEMSMQTVIDPETEKVLGKVYNPAVGQYDVVVTTGPSYSTKRQEALDAMIQLVQAQPNLWQVIGDLMVKNMDWPGADQMAERLQVTLLPAVQQLLKSKEGTQTLAQLQTMVTQMQQALQQAYLVMQTQQKEIEQLKSKEDIAAVEAQTKIFEAQKSIEAAQIKAHGEIQQAQIAASAQVAAAAKEHVSAIASEVGKLLQTHLQGLHDQAVAKIGATPPAPNAGNGGGSVVQEHVRVDATPSTLG